MKKIEFAGLVVFIIYWLHLLRNISPLYFAVLGLSIIFFLLLVKKSRKKIYFDSLFAFVMFFLCYATVVTFLMQSTYDDPGVGLFRFWAATPLIFIAMILASDSVQYKMRCFVFFYMIAAFTFPLQYATGAVSWFAEASERAGSERFASLVGSLTAYGVNVGVAALAALCFFSPIPAFLCFLILFMGGVLSLQKAAIANLLLAFLVGFWAKGRLKGVLSSALPALVVLCLLMVSGYFIFSGNELFHRLVDLALKSSEGIFSGDREISNDVNFVQSMIDRVTELPLEAINFHSLEALFFGAGVFGGAGALGYPELPMAHNGLVELVLIFGVPIGIVLNLYLCYFFISCCRSSAINNKKNLEGRFLIASYGLFFVNNIFAGGGFFQPVGASIFWLVFFRLRFLSKGVIRATHI